MPEGPPRHFRWRGVVHHVAPCRGTGAHRRRMVAQQNDSSRRATTTSSRTRRAAASGSSARASTAARPTSRAGSCTACSRGPMTAYAELAVTTNFSFLRGASHPQEMVRGRRARPDGHRHRRPQHPRRRGARPCRAAKERKDIQLLVGARLVTTDGFEVLAYPTDRDAYGRLCRLLTTGNRRAKKGECHLRFRGDPARPARARSSSWCRRASSTPAFTEQLAALARGRARAGLTSARRHRYRGDEPRRLGRLAELRRSRAVRRSSPSTTCSITRPSGGRLQDVVTCIREKCTIAEAGFRLEANAERHLKTARGDGAAVRRLSRMRSRARSRSPSACSFSLGRAQL